MWKYYLLFNISYYIPSIILFILDMFRLYKKIQPTDKIIDVYKKCMPRVLMNTFIYTIPPIYILSKFCNIFNISFSFSKMILDMIMGTLMSDVLLYTTHKILHIPPLYKWFHKKHHEITAPVGVSALYTTVVDMYFANILPLYLPLIILSSHEYTIMLWIVLVNINTVIISHGGIKMLSEFHDNHHKYFRVNFGMNMFMDYLFDYH